MILRLTLTIQSSKNSNLWGGSITVRQPTYKIGEPERQSKK